MLYEWLIYGAIFLSLLALDFFLTRGKEVSVKRALTMTGFYALVSMSFSVFMYFDKGFEAFSEYVTIYWLEQMLSVDNLLIISLIFGYFAIPKKHQHVALLYGIFGAIFFRVLFIAAGTAIVSTFSWVLYIFAAFLMYTGYKIVTAGDDGGMNPEDKKLIVWLKKRFGQSGAFIGAIIAIELTDIMFAVDSIPASFSISQDAYVILTANLFAVLGLRSLFHAVQAGVTFFEGIEKYIGAVLVLLGLEVFVHHLYHDLPAWVTMGGVFAVLGTGIVVSLRNKRN